MHEPELISLRNVLALLYPLHVCVWGGGGRGGGNSRRREGGQFEGYYSK